MMMKFNDFQKYEARLRIPYEKYFKLIYDTKSLLEARLSPDRTFLAIKSFYGCNRRMAVEKASVWYASHMKPVLGPPHKTMIIDDPLGEVVYDEEFVCTDLRNRFLDDLTIDRLLKDAKGDLGREESTSLRHAPASVRRLKKRRRQEIKLTDRLVQSSGGTIYYKMTDLDGGSSGRSKTKKIKLASKSLSKAKKEVIRRGLNKFEKFSSIKGSEFKESCLSVKVA